MGRSIPPMERERRDAINRNWAPVFDSIDRAAVLLATPYGGKNQTLAWYWVNRRCREALGDGITALAAGRYLEALPIAEQFERDAAAFMARAESIPLGERAAARRSFFRDPPDAAPKWQGAKSVPLKAPAPQYEKSGRVQAPEKANPADRQVRGVLMEQSKTSEEKDMALNGSAAAPEPQPERPDRPNFPHISGTNVVIPLEFGDAQGMALVAEQICLEVREILVDIETLELKEYRRPTGVAKVGLQVAAAIAVHLGDRAHRAHRAREVTP